MLWVLQAQSSLEFKQVALCQQIPNNLGRRKLHESFRGDTKLL